MTHGPLADRFAERRPIGGTLLPFTRLFPIHHFDRVFVNVDRSAFRSLGKAVSPAVRADLNFAAGKFLSHA